MRFFWKTKLNPPSSLIAPHHSGVSSSPPASRKNQNMYHRVQRVVLYQYNLDFSGI